MSFAKLAPQIKPYSEFILDGNKTFVGHGQKLMWMAYAQPYWTKVVDLRSAVERLDKEFSALEFNTNHEAVYGLENYYTVRECEQLQGKYEKGRKICIKFLQEIYCASCLIMHLKKVRLEQFVDRIKERIKDYSDSDASCDYACEEDDNKHANTAKEEEEEEEKKE
ncbi:hypothetical protein FQA39_LY13435 [Lamprigera yunnana]|nr:hypothetical protein FQA39_LY13435 [Lamprigera yunnana]